MNAGRVDVVVGVQWGDEGKGRVVDAMAGDYDVVARFAGGDNAGHTLVVGDRKVALRIVPSGALNERPLLFIGSGTVVSMETLVSELDALSSLGIDTGRIAISDRAQIVLPQHAILDALMEKARGGEALGTTGRGIGPAYADRAARTGVPFSALRVPAELADAVRANLRSHAARLAGAEIDEAAIVARTLELGELLRVRVVDGVGYLHDKLERGARILAEGAQGSLLDVAFGSYPFVTSSHTVAGAACAGLGIGPRSIDRIVGIAKAYCSRVGAGPFPTELHGAEGQALRERGREFGTVTGRPRRCGWFDGVAARYAARVNGLTEVFVTKLDVLTGLERLAIAIGYPEGTPAYEWFDGWSEDIGGVKRIADLPQAAGAYVKGVGEAFGVPLVAVSVGPERTELAIP